MNALDPDIQAAAERGDLVEAIKLLRHRTGLSLKDAKDAVESHLRGDKPFAAPLDGKIPLAAISALQEGKLIDAIQRTREATRLGLKDSKDAVQHYLATNPMVRERYLEAARRERRPLRAIVILALLVAAIVIAARALFH